MTPKDICDGIIQGILTFYNNTIKKEGNNRRINLYLIIILLVVQATNHSYGKILHATPQQPQLHRKRMDQTNDNTNANYPCILIYIFLYFITS